MKITHFGEIILVTMLLASSLLVGLTSSTSVYDPWCDLDEDGDIDIFDIVRMAGIYGTAGDPFEAKAALEYDSGWINITDMAGQYFNVTHNLNSTDSLVEITGKESSVSGPHQNDYGLTTHITTAPEWNHTYGGPNSDTGWSMIQVDDGYVITGYTWSFGAGFADVWLVKTDEMGNHLWNHTYGGPNSDTGYSVIQVDDGYVITGDTRSFGAGGSDVWLVKTDEMGNHLWNHTYGGPNNDAGHSVIQVDDGYVITGYTGSFGAGGSDVWLVKTDEMGNHLWNHTYGGPSSDTGWSMIQVDDGYVITGYTGSFVAGGSDVWLVKTDEMGNHLWNHTYGGWSEDYGFCVVQTGDGGFVITGYTGSFGAGGEDVWLVKTDAAGNHVWNRTYGGPNSDRGLSVIQTMVGAYVIAGYSESFGAGSQDMWLVKTDVAGNHLWNRTYGGTDYDWGSSVIQVDDGYVIAGGSYSFGSVGDSDFWLVKAYGPGEAPLIEVESGLAWTASTENTITLYRGEDDPYWNYVRVRIWKIRETP